MDTTSLSSRLVEDAQAAADMVQLSFSTDDGLPNTATQRKHHLHHPQHQHHHHHHQRHQRAEIHNGVRSSIPWSRIFWFLGDKPETVETLRQVCLMFRVICSDPTFRASFFIKRTCKHLAFNHVYTTRPWDLTFDMSDALLTLGAHLPKYFVEKMYDLEHQRAADERDGWQRLTPPIPQGTLEFLIAQGYKLYGDGLALNLPSEAALAVNSVLEKMEGARTGVVGMGLASAVPNMKVLKRVLYEHHYTPALNPCATVKEWDELWAKVLNLVRTDAEVGKFVIEHSGCSAKESNDGIVARALRDPKTKDNFMKWMTVNGFKITEGAVVRVLANPDVLQLDSIAGMSAIDLLRSSVGEELREEAVTRAFLVAPDALGEIPFMTALGRARGGMTDMMWQLILARYGARHPFASACLVDMVIGGTLKNPVRRGGGDAGMRRREGDTDAATRDSIEAMVEGAGVLIEPSLFGPISRSVLVTKKARPRILDFMARVEKGLLFATFDPSASPLDRQRWSKVRWIAALRRHVLDDRQWLEQMVSPEELIAMDERKKRERGPPRRSSGIFSTSSSSTVQFNAGQTSPTSDSFFAAGGLAGLGKTLGGMVRTRARGVAAAAAAAAAAHSGGGGRGGVSGFLGSMVVDLVDRDFAEVRRFYTCCELLVATLESAGNGDYSGRTPPPPPPASATGYVNAFAAPDMGPFARWLRDADGLVRAAAVAAQGGLSNFGGNGGGGSWWLRGSGSSSNLKADAAVSAGAESGTALKGFGGGRWF
ncbi:hypothetical protein BC829DRAFT_490303 [Chytridium lagenaria]|nr:hypothetical protein BC829DRAFT_490303 [Chytridium lagenaria]